MKQKLLFAVFAMLLLTRDVNAQTGYIYIHNKSIKEESSVNWTCNITGGPTSVGSFILNDDPTYLQVGDVGASHGAGADGEMWAISNSSSTIGVDASTITGVIYHRLAGSSQWKLAVSGITASAIDGAGLGTCVYVYNNNVYYFNGTTSIQIFFSTGTLGNATDVSYANGKTAITSSNGGLYYYDGAYTTNSTSNTGWHNLSGAGTGNGNARIDLNSTASTLAYIVPSGTVIKTIPVNTAGTAPTSVTIASGSGPFVNGSTGSTVSGAGTNDIAYDDNGVIYTIANVQYVPCSGTGTTGIVFRYSGGTWSEEGEGRGIVRLTGGAAGEMWGTCSVGFADAIWTRATDNTGAHVWLDDERVRTTVTNGNSIMIAVSAGTYTFTETVPSGYDVGRFNVYDPTGNTVASPFTNSVSINVSAGEVVNVECVNEFLVPKSIDLICATQILQTFGTGSSSSNTQYGPSVEGTAYHYVQNIQGTGPQDGYYFLVHQLVPGTNWFTYTNSYTVSDHTVGDVNGYFMVVNASYAKDEFYRQRVTNLVPGLQYTISFYVANVLNCNPIKPNINYGLQDASGLILDSASTGDISTNGTWTYKFFTFTATTSTADLFLRNNNIGGLGNDIALDDISLNPVLTTLGANQISPTVAPNLCIGTSYTFSNTPTGGIWTSSNSSLASINPHTGVANTIAGGTVIITYTYTNQVGCVSDTTRELIVTAAPTITASDLLGNSSCLNQTDSLFASATSTALPVSFAWTATPAGNGLGTANIANTTATPTAAGNYIYTVTATDAVGCATTANVSLAVSSHTAPTVSLATTGVNCIGNSANFTLTSSQSGGTGSYSWAWSGTPAGNGIVNVNATTTTASPTAAGTYTYTVKVSDGFCTVPVSKTVSAYASPSVTVNPTSGSNITVCNGGTVGLDALASGGSGTYTYAWTATGTGNGLQSPTNIFNPTAKPTSSGTDVYSVTVTDGNGCIASGSTSLNITLSSLAAPTITITSPTTETGACNGVGSVNLTATVTGGGLGSLNSYLWSGPGTITNPNSITTASTVPTSTGFYTLTVTNTLLLSSCTVSANTAVVDAWDRPNIGTISYAAVVCTNTKDSLYMTASGGLSPYTYLWTVSPSSGATIASSTSATSSVSFTTFDQTYTFTGRVTDAHGCRRSSSIDIAALNQSGPSTSGMASAATLCTGSSVSLSPSVTQGVAVTTISNSSTTTFASSQSSSTHSSSKITNGFIGDYWQSNNNNNEYVGLDLGATYTISSVDITPRNTTTGRNSLIGAKIQISNTSSSSGYTTLYTFSSAPSGTTHNYAVSGTGRYLRVLYTNSTTGYLDEMVAYSSATTAISSYTWSANPSSGAGLGSTNTLNTTIAPTVAGSYKYYITILDAVGCKATDSTGTQTVLTSPTISPLTNNPAFCGSTGSLQVFANPGGGSGTYNSYAWTYTKTSGSGSITYDDAATQNPTATVGGTSAGSTFTFTVTVTDANTCTASGTTTAVVVSNVPTASATAALASTACVGQVINLTGKVLSATTAPYTYTWTPSSNSVVDTSSTTTSATIIHATASTTAAGNYLYGLSVLDANNCSAASFTTSAIAINDTPQVAITTNSTGLACANPTTTITLTGTASGGSGSYTNYAWTGSGVVTASTGTGTSTAKPTVDGVYGVTVTDGNSCKATAYSTAVNIDEASPLISNTCDPVAGFDHLYEQNGVSWLWTTTSGGRFFTDATYSTATDSTSSQLQAPFIKFYGDYFVTIKNANGCIGSGNITVGTCGTVLAVNILDFTAQKAGSKVLLNWSTVTELNNDHFDVERSADGVNWSKLGVVKGHGSSNVLQKYSFTDGAPLNGSNYYRLKQVNFDASYGFSDVRAVQFGGTWLVHVYPNPAREFLVLEFNSEKDEKAQVSIQTMLGGTIFVKEQQIVKGPNKIVLTQVQPLAQATYVITLATETNVFRSKFVKGSK